MISAYELALHIYEHRVAILFLIWLPGGHSRIAGISGPGKGSPGRGGRIVELHRVMICFAVPQGRCICGIRKEEGDLYAVGCPEVGIVAFPRKAIIIYRGSPADLSPNSWKYTASGSLSSMTSIYIIMGSYLVVTYFPNVSSTFESKWNPFIYIKVDQVISNIKIESLLS